MNGTQRSEVAKGVQKVHCCVMAIRGRIHQWNEYKLKLKMRSNSIDNFVNFRMCYFSLSLSASYFARAERGFISWLEENHFEAEIYDWVDRDVNVRDFESRPSSGTIFLSECRQKADTIWLHGFLISSREKLYREFQVIRSRLTTFGLSPITFRRLYPGTIWMW